MKTILALILGILLSGCMPVSYLGQELDVSKIQAIDEIKERMNWMASVGILQQEDVPEDFVDVSHAHYLAMNVAFANGDAGLYNYHAKKLKELYSSILPKEMSESEPAEETEVEADKPETIGQEI